MESLLDRKLGTLTAWVTAGLCFLVVFAITVMGLMLWGLSRQASQDAQLRQVANETHQALCAFEKGIRRQHDTWATYLRLNPKGFTSENGDVVVPAVYIQSVIDAHQGTLNALVVLTCTGT